MGVQPSPPSTWEDVGPCRGERRKLKIWRRRQPLHALDEGRSNEKHAIIAAGGCFTVFSPKDNVVRAAEACSQPLGYSQVCWSDDLVVLSVRVAAAGIGRELGLFVAEKLG